MSIKPPFWERIADGTKEFELRRTTVRLREGDLVVVYASSPDKSLVGCFEVGEVIRAPKGQLWRELGSALGVSRATFRSYLEGTDFATAIAVRNARTFQPIPLTELRRRLPDFRPPQSFMYWPEDSFRRLRLGAELAMPADG